jgi:hypothetical protein
MPGRSERAQVPMSLGGAMFLPTVGKIAERHPGLKLIVDRRLRKGYSSSA